MDWHDPQHPIRRAAAQVEPDRSKEIWADLLELDLAGTYLGMGRHAQVLPLYHRALEVFRATHGEAHPDFAKGLNNLAGVYRAMGDHEAALPLYRQALEIRRATLGENHPDFAKSLTNLAALYEERGYHALALPLYRRALEVFRATHGEAHPDFAEGLNNLGGLYRAMGDYAAALPLFRQALEIRRATLGENHPDFANNLNHLGTLYLAMGDYAAALPLFRQALGILRAAWGDKDLHVASSLNNLAALYYMMGDYAAALPLCRQALEVRRATLRENHPDFARSLNNLAALYEQSGDHAAALPLRRQALEVRRAALGENHPDFAKGLINLGGLYREMGDLEAALPLARQALEVFRATHGEAHPDFAIGLNNLAMLHVAQDRPFDALPLYEQALASDYRQIAQVFSFGSERQRVAFLNTGCLTPLLFISLVLQHLSSDQKALGTALNVVLRTKALVAETLSAQRDAILGGRYPALQDRLRELTALRQQITRKALAGPGPEELRAHLQLITQWEERKEHLEGDLARHIPEMNLEQQLRAADRRAIALALPLGCALIEFVRISPFDFKAVPARGERSSQPPRYLAFVLPSGEPDAVRMIDLGEAEPIDQLIADFRAGITGEAEFRGLTKATHRPTLQSEGNASVRLRAALFDPLADTLRSCQRLLLAPDGDLNRLPLGLLPLADGRLLHDAYRIHYVSVGRDVLRFQAPSGRPPAEPLVISDPDFDLSPGSQAARATGSEASAGAPKRGFWHRLFVRRQSVAAQPPPPVRRLSRDLDPGRYNFPRLPGTRAEGEQIARRLGVQPIMAGAALEGRLKACRSPRILHLATHGFFLADKQRDLNKFGRNLELIDVGDRPDWEPLSGPGMENPMLRSGLALAGANTFLRGGSLPDDAEDGLLTAEDVAGLNLLDTELVVLSACDTGLGEVHTGEGVMGLRRAFIVAGAKTLVMSLWKVDDLATAFLMDLFYDNLLTCGLDRDLALSEAQRATRDVTVGQLRAEWLSGAMIDRLAAGDVGARRALRELAAMPDGYRPFEHPFYWGAFICQGDPSPLPRAPDAVE
jgi:CHAT domain-containing protein/tetratricopeptide (TPR) repeat protein